MVRPREERAGLGATGRAAAGVPDARDQAACRQVRPARQGRGPDTHAGRRAGRWEVPAGPVESRAFGGRNVTEFTSPVRALWPEAQVLAPPCWDRQRDRTPATLSSFQRVTRASRVERLFRDIMPRTCWGHSPSGGQLGGQTPPGPGSEGQLPSRTHAVHRGRASGEGDGPARSGTLPRGPAPTGRGPTLLGGGEVRCVARGRDPHTFPGLSGSTCGWHVERLDGPQPRVSAPPSGS